MRRARAGRIQPETIQVQTGVEQRGVFSKKTVPIHEDRLVWVIRPDKWEPAGEIEHYHPGLGVLDDGTCILGLDPRGGFDFYSGEGRIRQTPLPDGKVARKVSVEGVIEALGQYLADRDA